MAGSLSFGKFWTFHIYRNLVTDGLIRSVTDIGAGSGTYVRFLRHCDETAHWKALEAWGPNIVNHHLKHQYDEVICGDVRYIDWAKAGGADAVICGDVLEHMTKAEAIRVVSDLMETSKIVFISIPIIFHPQGEHDQNPFERHIKDDWNHNEIQNSFPGLCCGYVDGYIGVYALSDDPVIREKVVGYHNEFSQTEHNHYNASKNVYLDMINGFIGNNFALFFESYNKLMSNGIVSFNLGLIAAASCVKCRMYADAERLLSNLIAHNPNYAQIHLLRGAAFSGQNKKEEAFRSFSQALRLSASPGASAISLGELLWDKGEIQQAYNYFSFALRDNMFKFKALVRLGALNVKLEDYETAERNYTEASSLSEDGGKVYPPGVQHITRFSSDFFNTVTNFKQRLQLPAINHLAEVQNADTIFYLSSDTVYFQKYGVPCINSIISNCPNSAIHIHLINPEAGVTETINKLSSANGYPINISVENTDFGDLNYEEKKAYLTIARFIRFPEIIRRYGKRIILIDMDLIVNADINKISALMENHDAGMFVCDELGYNNGFWVYFGAATVWVNFTENALRYIDLVSSYVHYFFRKRRLFWFIDEIGLFCSWIYMQNEKSEPEIRIMSIPRKYMGASSITEANTDNLDELNEKEFGKDVIFWSIMDSHPPNRIKKSLPGFLKYTKIPE